MDEQENNIPENIKTLLETFEANTFKINFENQVIKKYLYGTTLYLATCHIDMEFGPFVVYIFQDIIHKGYIIALTCGDIFTADTLYTRVHSSCVTSETLRGCDCDCVEQLEGALKFIAENKKGIVFYLMQEGRGVGYIAKARDRMLVQASQDSISTFDAYKLLGLKRDYRQYRNVVPICKMLNITSKFVLLTNNPTKLQILKEEGLSIIKTEPLEFKPGPHNLFYLKSKQQAGHILQFPQHTHHERIKTPEPVIPFHPYALEEAQRFIYTASYFLPIKPVNNEIILNTEQFNHFFKDHSIDEYIESDTPLLESYSIIRNNRYKIKINEKNLQEYKQSNPQSPLVSLLHIPYWFRIHVYFDIITGDDFVVLTYGNPTDREFPVVRLQSESLFNRFPLVDTDNKDKYNATLQEIMKYGTGVIVLLYNDGRGAGLGAYAEDLMFTELKISKSTTESYQKLGVSYDRRDYEAAITLLKTHLPTNKVQMVMNSPSSLVTKNEYAVALNKLNLDVKKWIFLE